MILDTDFLIAIDDGIQAAHTLGDRLGLAEVPYGFSRLSFSNSTQALGPETIQVEIPEATKR